ncbi:hypothetical protein GC176_18485 [bacterium]|nr:hypothetical protein [bacterium]
MFVPAPTLVPPDSVHESTIPGVSPGTNQIPPPPNGADSQPNAAYDHPIWNPQTDVPEIRDASTRRYRLYEDQRMAVEMWPHSPQYTGRR